MLKQPRRINVSLEAMRGAAAVLVVLGHARFFTYATEDRVASGAGLERLVLAPTSFAREAVAVFFVLSGYFVGGEVIRHLRRDTFSASDFAVKRLTRLWAVLVPGLVVTALLSWSTGETSRVGAETAACNLAFLNPTRCDNFGTNDSLWSLGYELWFYVLFAAAGVLVASVVRRQWRTAVVAAAVGAGAVLAYSPALLLLMPAWLLGAGVAASTHRNTPRLRRLGPGALWVTGAVLLGALAAVTVMPVGTTSKYLVLGLACAPLVAATVALDPRPSQGVAAQAMRVGAWFGTWSFTLYVFHLPVLLGLLALSPFGVGVWQTYLLAGLTIAACFPAFWLGEAHTSRLRSLLSERTVGRRRRRVGLER